MSRVEFDGYDIEFFVAHFPAAKNPLKSRIAAADTMKKAIKNSQNGVILGDLNSNYGYKFLLNDLDGWTNLWEFIPTSQRSSYKNGKSAIDHMFIPNKWIVEEYGLIEGDEISEITDHKGIYANVKIKK